MAVVDCAVAAGSFLSAGALEGGAAAALGGAAIGAGAGGLYSAVTGDGNVLNSMLNGALIGGAGMGLGAAAGLTGATGTSLGLSGEGLLGSSAALPSAAGVVAPGAGAAPVATGGIGSAVAPGVTSAVAPASTVLPSVSGSAFTPAEIAAGVGNPATSGLAATGQYAPEMMGEYGGPQIGSPEALASNVANVSTGGNAALNPSFWDSSMGTYTKYGLGALGLGALMKNDNKKYGTIANPASNPLPYASNFGTYQPLDTSVMRPMGTPSGPYTGTPYGAPGYTGSKVGYADGGLTDANPMQNPSVGPVEQMSRDNALGQNQMFPQANINSPAFSSATNTPMGSNMISPAGDTNVDPYSGAERFADGGLLEQVAMQPINQLQAAANNPEQALIGANTPFETNMWNSVLGTHYTPLTNMWGTPTDAAVAGNVSQGGRPTYGGKAMAAGGIAGHSSLGGYAAGGNPRLLKGPGDGMSDNIPATIGDKQPARLADGEFVVPADVVSHLGNGSTDAGAKHLYSMMDKVRKARTGNKAQGKQIKADKFLPK